MRAPAAAAAALLLVACGGQDGNRTNASGNAAGGPAGTAGGPDALQAGQWEMVSAVTAMELPGAPPEAQAQIASQLNRPNVERTCITPERAANPLRDFREMLTRGQPGAECQASDSTFAGGIIRIGVTCRDSGGAPGQGRMTMEGSFTATTLQATLAINGEGPGAGGTTQRLRLTSTVRGRRIGDCPANAQPGGGQPGNAQLPDIQPGNAQ